MKIFRFKIIIVSLFTIIALTQASPSILGGRGLFQVEDAYTEDLGVLTLSTYLLGHKDMSNAYIGDWVVPNIVYTPANFLELFFRLDRTVESEIKFPEVWDSKFHSSPRARTLGGKVCIPFLPVFKIGGKVGYVWPHSSVSNSDKGLIWTGLAAFKFNEFFGSLPNFILNYGESKNWRNYSAGLEISGSGGSIFVEANTHKDKNGGIFKNILDSLTITPGFKLNSGPHSYFSGGVILDVKNNPNIPDYTAIIGLTLGGAFLKPLQPKFGIITGTITDVSTGSSLPATITFPEKPKLKPIQSNAQTGVFKGEKISSGVIIVEVTCEGYQKLTVPISVEANKVNAYDFKLKPSVTFGVIAGNVYDATTEKPIEATITFSNNSLPEIKSDSITGSFKIEKIQTGVLTIEAKKDGYYQKAVTISVEEGKVVQVDFPLVSSVFRGVFTGKISDKVSGIPLKGVVTFTGAMLTPVLSDSITGTFQTEMPVGTYSVTVIAEGFLPFTGVVTIEKDKTNQVNFELIPSEFKTILTGKVSDKKTGIALQSTISFPEVGIQPIVTDSVTGVYRTEIPIGSYLVEIKSEGYITQTAMVVLEKEKALEKNFELVKVGMTITLKGVYFEFGKATLKAESYSILQDAAKILSDNPSINVEIQGHTDNIGSESYNQMLSQKRAYAVMEYLVKTLGVTPTRLIAKGYGSTKPITSNDTEEGRALNRRVDFAIMEK
jgi:outer membrane protein OmpA-like peptidoglycan-associated protein